MAVFNPFLQNMAGAGFWPGQMAQDPRLAFMQGQMPMPQPIQATPLPTPQAVPPAPRLTPPNQAPAPQPGAIGRALAGPQAAPQLTPPRVMPTGTRQERDAFQTANNEWWAQSGLPRPETTPTVRRGSMAAPNLQAPAPLTPPPAASETFADMQAPPGPLTQEVAQRNPRSRLEQFGFDMQDAFTPERMDALALFTNLIDAGRAKWLGEWDDGRAAGWGAAADALQNYQDRGEARDIREEDRALRQAAEERAQAAERRAAVEAKQDAVRFEWEGKDAAEEERQRQSLEAWINTRPEAERVALRAQPEIAREMMIREIVPADFQPDGAGRFVRFNRQTGAPEYFTNPDGSVFEAPLSQLQRIDIGIQQARIAASRPSDPNDVRPMTTTQLLSARDRLAQSQDLLAAVQNFRTMVENASPNALLGIGSEGAALESAHRTLAMLAKGPAGLDLGALVGADFDILSGILGEPGNWRQFAQSEGQDGILARIDQFNNFAQTGQRRLLAQYSPWQDQLSDYYTAPPALGGPDFSSLTNAQLTEQLNNANLTDAQLDALEAEVARRRGGGGTAPTAAQPQQTVMADLPRLISPAEAQSYGIDLRGRRVGEVVTVNGARYRVTSPGRGQLSLQRID